MMKKWKQNTDDEKVGMKKGMMKHWQGNTYDEKVGDFPSIDFGDLPPPSKCDKTHYWPFIASLCGRQLRQRLFSVRVPLQVAGSFVRF